MDNISHIYNSYVEIADGVYWVGFFDSNAGFRCNPYLIVDDGEAVLIDGGSRNHFSTVMLKIMRTGLNPHHIKRLIYQHFDPDLCGNIPHMEAVIDSENLKIISHHENNIYINYYSMRSPKQCIEQLGYAYEFGSGRRLEFIRTPYSHSPGSFVTYDTKTRTLFSSDIFGSYDSNLELYWKFDEACARCELMERCPKTNERCQMRGIVNFHQRNMTTVKALRYALDRIGELDVSLIAPQHGAILNTAEARQAVMKQLRAIDTVGFDYFLEGRS